MKSLSAAVAALACSLVLSAAPAGAHMSGSVASSAGHAAAPTLVTPVKKKGAAIAAGVALGVLGIIAASQAAKARSSDRDDDRRGEHYRECRRLLRKCENGSDRACDRYEENCDY